MAKSNVTELPFEIPGDDVPVTEEGTNEKVKMDYSVEVTSARLLKEYNFISFNATVNGVRLSGLQYCWGKAKNTGVPYEMIKFPQNSYKTNKGETKYSNIVWFPISKELQADIKQKIQKELDKNKK